jgi:hypothetical protein
MAKIESKAPKANAKNDDIVKEAQDRFERCKTYEFNARHRFIEDLKFANADSDNQFQWPDTIRKSRELDQQPCLTINKTRQHCLQITNDARQNKPGIGVRATGDGATSEAASAISGIMRFIEYHSNAQATYDHATSFQVQAGIGYWRVTTDYADDDTFDQDIFIKPIHDPLAVYIDPDAREIDKSDMWYAIIFEDMPHDKFDSKYPGKRETVGERPLKGGTDWLEPDHIRVAEYFRKVEEKDTLVMLPSGQTVHMSQLEGQLKDDVLADPTNRFRDVMVSKITWYLIAGDKIIQEETWPGKYIPIVPLIGEETVIDGKLDRKGHTRALKDPQRMYNYWSSVAVEFGALQSKTPYLAPMAAIDSHIKYWENANRVNHAFLPYNAWDEDGRQLPPPQRQEPPVAAPVAMTGMEVAQKEMMLVSGQHESEMGEPSNERSAKAISKRQRQGDNATYHYIDNLAIAIRHTGRIILDLIPHIYDTERVLMILAEDGTSYELKVDPEAQEVYAEKQDHNTEVAERVLNPKVGKYEVQAAVGPAYATRREEAFDAFTLILTQAPQLAEIIGDILFKAGDFPMADEAAARLRRMVPREALGLGPTQQEQELQQQIEQLNSVLKIMMEELGKKEMALARQEEKGKIDREKHAAKDEVDRYKAFTERLRVIGQQEMDESSQRLAVAQLMKDLLMSPQEGSPEGQMELPLQQQPMAQGPELGGQDGNIEPRQAKDGNWYIPNPEKPGKYMRIKLQ